MKTVCKVLGLFLVSALVLASGEPYAQGYPNRPIKFVTGNPPGGGTDVLARGLAPKLSERLGQPIIVENKPGADGIIASEYVARSDPDGYVLMVGTDGQMVLNRALYAKLPYDPVNDFAPVIRLSYAPLVMAVHPSVPARSVAELIALAKAKRGELFYGSGFPAAEVAAEIFKYRAGADIVKVRYKGAAPARTAAVAGQVGVLMSSIGPVLGQLRSGQLRGLAVTSPARFGLLPDIPTMADSGLADVDVVPWTGLFAPAATPREVIDKLNSNIAIVLKLEDLKQRFAASGISLDGSSPAELGDLQKADIAKWIKRVKDLKLPTK